MYIWCSRFCFPVLFYRPSTIQTHTHMPMKPFHIALSPVSHSNSSESAHNTPSTLRPLVHLVATKHGHECHDHLYSTSLAGEFSSRSPPPPPSTCIAANVNQKVIHYNADPVPKHPQHIWPITTKRYLWDRKKICHSIQRRGRLHSCLYLMRELRVRSGERPPERGQILGRGCAARASLVVLFCVGLRI